jgi:UDP-GlcNAc:undecaprenyl-phosphate GlcNAc-1-phosphate transferase
VAIASGTLCVYGLRLEDLGLLPATNVGPLIAALTCGICIGFLRDNFHPAKLFMGDAGALMLGLLMSASTMVIGGRTPRERRDVLLLRSAVDSRLHPRRAAR